MTLTPPQVRDFPCPPQQQLQLHSGQTSPHQQLLLFHHFFGESVEVGVFSLRLESRLHSASCILSCVCVCTDVSVLSCVVMCVNSGKLVLRWCFFYCKKKLHLHLCSLEAATSQQRRGRYTNAASLTPMWAQHLH